MLCGTIRPGTLYICSATSAGVFRRDWRNKHLCLDYFTWAYWRFSVKYKCTHLRFISKCKTLQLFGLWKVCIDWVTRNLHLMQFLSFWGQSWKPSQLQPSPEIFQIRGKIMACSACAGGRWDLAIWHGLGGPRQIEEMSNQHQLPAPSFYNAMSSGGKLTKYRLFVGKILALPNHLKVWVQPGEDKRDFVKKQQCVLRQQWKTFFMKQ